MQSTAKPGNYIYWKWACYNIRNDSVDKTICIFQNLEEVIFLAWNKQMLSLSVL